MHRYAARLVVIALLLGGAVFGIGWGAEKVGSLGPITNMFAAVQKSLGQKSIATPPQPTVQQLATGNKTYLVIPVHFADSSKYEQRTPTQKKEIFDKVRAAYSEFSNARLNINFAYAPTIELPWNLVPSPHTYGYASLGTIGITGPEYDGFAVLGDYRAGGGDIDRALCATPYRIEAYDGVILFFEEDYQRHVQAQRQVSFFGEGSIIFGQANNVLLETVDCDDFSKSKKAWKGVAYIFGGLHGPDPKGAFGYSDDGMVTVIAHEIGHTLGFGHAGDWVNREYGNTYDLMGGSSEGAHPGAYYKAIAGWIDDAIIEAVSSGEYRIFPIEQSDGPVALRFEGFDGLGVKDETSFIEFRQDLGRDSALPVDATQGALINKRAAEKNDVRVKDLHVAQHRTILKSRFAVPKGRCALVKGGRDALVRVEDLVVNNSLTLRTAFLDDRDSVVELGCGVDLVVDDVTITPAPKVGQMSVVTVHVKNEGSDIAKGYRVHIPQIASTAALATSLSPGKSDSIQFSWTPRQAGSGSLDVDIYYDDLEPEEYVTENNAKNVPVVVKDVSGRVPGKPLPKQKYNIKASMESSSDGEEFYGVMELSFVEGYAEENSGSILCNVDCGEFFNGAAITVLGIDFSEYPGMALEGFSGPCTGMTCSFTLTKDVEIGVKVSAAKTKLSLTKSGTGSGKIHLTKTEPQGGGVVVCDDCSGEYSFPKGTIIDARATALAGSDFTAWSGGFCTPDPADKFHCQGTLGDNAVTIGAEFTRAEAATLNKEGSGKGKVVIVATTADAQTKTVECIDTCTTLNLMTALAPIREATLTLTASPSRSTATSKDEFRGWSGQCTGTAPTCTMTMNGSAPVMVGARFEYLHKVTVTRTGSVATKGVVSTQQDPKITCGDTCAQFYVQGTNLVLTTTPEIGYHIKTWGGDCATATNTATCTLTNIQSPKNVTMEYYAGVKKRKVTKDCVGGPPSCSFAEIRATYENGINIFCGIGCPTTGWYEVPYGVSGTINKKLIDLDTQNGYSGTWGVAYCTGAGSAQCVCSGGSCDIRPTRELAEQPIEVIYAPRSYWSRDLIFNTGSDPVPRSEESVTDADQEFVTRAPKTSPTPASLSSAFSKFFSPFTKPLFSRITGSSPQRASLTSGGADLVAVDAIISPSLVTPNKSHSITAFVANNGDAAYGDYFGTSLRITRDGAPADEYPFERYRYTASLASAGVEEIAWPYAWTPTAEGTYTVSLCVDRFRSVTDVNPANDCLTPFSVTVSSAITILRTGPAKVNEGTVIKNINPTQDMSGVSKQRNYGNVLIGSAVSLRAVPNAGFQFTKWSGDDALKCRYPNGDRTTCMFTMTAETKIYANFIAAPAGLLGDVNNDNTLTAVDALAILKSAVGQTISLPNMNRADVDCNGKVQAKDALVVLKASVGSIPTPLVCATADAASTGNITFTKTGDGTGTVAPLTPVQRANDTELAFTATPTTGSSFAGWEGDCTGTGECRVTVNGFKNATIRARFTTGSVTPPPTTPPPVTPPPPPTGDAPDLVTLGDRDLRITPAKPTANRDLSVLAKIQNQGKAQSRSFIASLRIDKDNNGTWDFADVERILPLKVNQYKALKFKKAYTPPTTGTYKIEVCVDDGALSDADAIPSPIPNYTAGPTAESSETNNCQSMTVDVLPEKGKASAAAGALAALTLLVGVPVGIAYLARSRSKVSVE